MREFKLVALIYPDKEAMRTDNISIDELTNIMETNKGILNKSVAQYERLSAIEIVEIEFEKTPKKSIKRFLYQ